jgi:Undecaprenyl-phosphate glucose phosphotransferase
LALYPCAPEIIYAGPQGVIVDQNDRPDSDTETVRSSRADRSALMTPALLRDLIRISDLAFVGSLGSVIYFIQIHPVEPQRLGQYLAALVLALLLLAMTGQMLGLYQPGVIFERRLRIGRSMAAWTLVFAALFAVAFALKISDVYSRVWAFSWFLIGISALGLFRIALSMWIERQVRVGLFANRTVIIGVDQQAKALADHLANGDTLQTRILGLIDDQPHEAENTETAYDHLGDLDTLTSMVRDGQVDQVIIALPWHEIERVRAAAYQLAIYPVTVCLAPGLASFDFPSRTYIQISGVPMLQLYSQPFSGWARILKGLEDRILAAGFLVTLAPLMALIAVAIRIESPGSVLFSQERYGFNNNLIKVFKFRTMYEHLTDANAEQLTTRGDPRVTKVGRLLRRTSLDELPQFFNVLRGEMSLVGPRPHAVSAKAAGQLYDEAVDRYAARHKVKPGLTGWAQVNGWRGDTDTLKKLRKRVEYDLYYIDNWSVWFDLVIIARSIAIIFGDKEAY